METRWAFDKTENGMASIVLKSALGERNEAHYGEKKKNRAKSEDDRKMGASFLFPNNHRLLDGSAQMFLIYFFPYRTCQRALAHIR